MGDMAYNRKFIVVDIAHVAFVLVLILSLWYEWGYGTLASVVWFGINLSRFVSEYGHWQEHIRKND